MNTLKKIAKEFGAPVLALAIPLMASAQFQGPGVTAPDSPVTSVTDLTGSGGLFCTIINWLFYLLIIGAVIFVLVAAFKYLTAGGDPEKVKAAGSTLLYAVIAVVIALIAKGIPFIASSFIGGGSVAVC
jgi:uncharacterized membrane protein